MAVHYQQSPAGLSIFGSYEKFNRVLYGGHENDFRQERFFTFSGDTPIFMGASSDYTKDTWCYQAKNGVLMSGLAMTEGFCEGGKRDIFSKWFHNSSDVLATWKHGYMEYELSQISSYFPDVRVKIQVYPLNPDDGFLVHYDITTDQRTLFCAGLGGITPFFGRFEYHFSARKEFSAEDCKGNTASLEEGLGVLKGPNEVTLLLGSDFPCEMSTDSPQSMEELSPSLFLAEHEGEKSVLKIKKILQANEHFRGNLIVVRNGSKETVKKYLSMPDVCAFLRGRIRDKFAAVTTRTPDALLDQSVPDTIIAEDAAFHGKSFYHGAIGYHAPFLGWRGWYAPSLLGWHDRVMSAAKTHFDTITRFEGQEKIYWDGSDRPDLDHEGTQYHRKENSSGHLTALLHRDDIYDMQEVAMDMTLYGLQSSGDLESGNLLYDRICEVLDWEERILDPDGDGLYQNFLNTWISDGHSYNGAGCAQASAYNYFANREAALLGKKLNRDVSKLLARAEKIRTAMQKILYLPESGVMAESIDTIGNKLIHPSPELSTTYLSIDCDTVDPIQAYRMLFWTENNIETIRTAHRKGTLYFSSNWLPKKYSTDGIFPAENAALALAYYKTGLKEKAFAILNGLLDAFALSPNPGSISHVLSALGSADGGDIDFTDVSSCYLRLVLEGLFGVRFRLLEDVIRIAPQFPDSWDHASLTLPDLSLQYQYAEPFETLQIVTDSAVEKIIRLPLRFASVDQVYLNGKEITEYEIKSGFHTPVLEVKTRLTGKVELKVCYNTTGLLPALRQSEYTLLSGSTFVVQVENGSIDMVESPDGACVVQDLKGNEVLIKVLKETPGNTDCFLYSGNAILPLKIQVKTFEKEKAPLKYERQTAVDMSGIFNSSLTEIHNQEFRSPRPEGYSIGMRLNGRYAWEWNHFGHNALKVDDSVLRNGKGRITTESNLQFATPAAGNNAVSVSLWDNFPTSAVIPLSGKGTALAVLLSGTTHAMQSYVPNGRLTLVYEDGSVEKKDLIQPLNFDDFLISSYQKENEVFYFGAGTHGLVQILPLDGTKDLKELRVEAIANEVIVNIHAVTVLS